MKPKTRLLFVDDEPQVLRMLQLALKTMSQEWELAFVGGGEQALAAMADKPFDIVVSDMRMPRMNGAELLNEVMKRYPQTVRLILSGYSDQDLVLKCVGATHQYLSKPFDLAALKATLSRIASLNARLANADLRALVARIGSLPSVPSIYLQMLEALQSPDSPIEAIGEIIARDPAVTAKILQLVNSAFFGFARSLTDVTEAVQLLGVGIIRSLALSIRLFAAFEPVQFRNLALDQVWTHSLRAGLLARKIAHVEGGDEHLMEQAFTAGLLHDVGKLILAANLPEAYREVLNRAQSQGWPVFQAETGVFKTTHAEVGGYLLGLWGLPAPLVEAVTFHHCPAAGGPAAFGALAAVHIANALTQPPDLGGGKAAPPQVEADYLQQLGLAQNLPEWQRLADAL